MTPGEVVRLAIADANRAGDERRAERVSGLWAVSIYHCFRIQRNQLRLAHPLHRCRQSLESVDGHVLEELLRLLSSRGLQRDILGERVKFQLDVQVTQSLIIRLLDLERVKVKRDSQIGANCY